MLGEDSSLKAEIDLKLQVSRSNYKFKDEDQIRSGRENVLAGKEGSEQVYIMSIQVDFGHKLTKFDNCPCKARTFLL